MHIVKLETNIEARENIFVLYLLKTLYFTVKALTETQELRVTNMSSAVVMVYIDSAINLPVCSVIV